MGSASQTVTTCGSIPSLLQSNLPKWVAKEAKVKTPAASPRIPKTNHRTRVANKPNRPQKAVTHSQPLREETQLPKLLQRKHKQKLKSRPQLKEKNLQNQQKSQQQKRKKKQQKPNPRHRNHRP